MSSEAAAHEIVFVCPWCMLQGLGFRIYGHVKRFRGGLVFKAHRLVYHSTLGWRVIKKKKLRTRSCLCAPVQTGYLRATSKRLKRCPEAGHRNNLEYPWTAKRCLVLRRDITR